MERFLFLIMLFVLCLSVGCTSSKLHKANLSSEERLSCSNTSESTIENEKEYLNSLNVTDLTSEERRAYYYENGMLHYVNFSKNRDEESFLKAKEHFEKSWSEYGEKGSLNNLAILYLFHGDCDLAKETFNLYLMQLEEGEKNNVGNLRMVEHIEKCKK